MVSRVLAALLVLPIALAAQNGAAPAKASFAEPGISPDGATIAFVSGGDIWEVPARGGDARLLVSHQANESRPMFSPDGASLAFTSTRTGNGDIYVLTIATGDLTRLTVDDANDLMNGWSPDSRWIYFSSGSHDLGSMNDVWRVSIDGGTPQAVAADRYATEYFGAPAPSGDVVAITARAFAGSQWWRKGHSHLDESEIWLVRPGAQAPSYEQVTKGGAKDVWPMWGGDGKTLYFMSDRSGAQNVWSQPIGGAARAVTTFRDGRVLWPTITKDGRTVAFERDFGIWTVDTSSGDARDVPISLRGAPAGTAVEHRAFTDQIQELALSPDGKKIAFTVHGEVFSASAKDGGDAARLTETAAEEFGLAWAPDSRRIVYVSDRDGTTDHLYLYDFGTERETQLTTGTLRDQAPLISPSGRWVAYQRGNRELHVIDPATKEDRIVARAILRAPRNGAPLEYHWSPDSRYLASITTGPKSFQNLSVIQVDAPAEVRAASFLANTNAGSVQWSPDGTYLTYVTSQRTEPGQVVRVDLLPRTPRFREDQFRELFKDESPRPDTSRPAETTNPADTTKPADSAAAPPKPDAAADPASSRAGRVEIVYDDIRRRAGVLPTGVDVTQQIISPDGKMMLLRATAADQENLYIYPLDDLAREPAVARQLTSTPGSKQSPQFTPDSKAVVYLDRGRIFFVTVERRETRPVAVTAELDVDFAREKFEVFHQAWSVLRDQFNDEAMNGVDWSAVRAMYEPHVAGAHTGDELRRIISLMLGELNASHMGISAPGGSTQATLGRLAVDFDRAEFETNGRLRITDVVALGPAALAGIKPGEYIVRVDGKPIDRRANIDTLLNNTIGKRVELAVAASPGGSPRTVGVKPVNQTTERGLRYRQWVEERRAYVSKASNGRLGYVHMLDMSAAALSQLQIDLDADNHAREGVVIDVRNNNGGFVNVYALDVLTRRGYFNMAQRGVPIAPVSSRTLLGQHALERPTILVTNQHSLSDAEDFTEGYRTLKLGKVVGEPTAGWIIYTGSVTLIDGSALRMPSTKILANDGSPMEMHPRPVDIEVTRPMGESYSGKDRQLDAAVAELLKQLGTRTSQ